MGCRWRIYLELGLASNLVNRCLISELSDKLVSLNVNVLFAWWGLGRLNIPCEELFSGLGSLLLEALRVVLAFVRLEKLVRVGSCRNDHSSVRASAEHTLVVHDVLREVLILISATIWVLVFLFLGYDAGMGCKTLPSCSAT